MNLKVGAIRQPKKCILKELGTGPYVAVIGCNP